MLAAFLGERTWIKDGERTWIKDKEF